MNKKLMSLDDRWETGAMKGMTLRETIEKNLSFVAWRRSEDMRTGDRMGGLDEEANVALDLAIIKNFGPGKFKMFNKTLPKEPDIEHPSWGSW